MKISVIIPNWNGERLIEKNFSSWLSIGADEIVIVDDASTDGSAGELKSQISKLKAASQNISKAWPFGLKLIENKKNLGFGKAVNRGVETASGDIIILLNTDVRPLPGLLKATLTHFRDDKVFGVSFSEEQWSWGRGKWSNGFVEHEPGIKTKNSHSTFWVSGGSGAFRRSIWDKLGGFDEIYAPFYWEDIDLSYRALKRGYKLLWEPKAKVIHEHEGTIGKYFKRDYVNFIQERNQLIFIWKNITSEEMFKEHRQSVLKRFLRNPGYAKVILAALSRWFHITRSREKEKKAEVVSDAVIFARFND